MVSNSLDARLTKLFRISSGIAAFVHLILALIVFIDVLNQEWIVPFFIRYTNWTETDDSLDCGEKGNVCTLSLSERDAGTANIGIIVPFFSFVSGVHHLYAGLNTDGYIESIYAGGANPYRAWDYALSSGLMIVIVSILFRAPSDPTFLVVLALLQAMICFMGYTIELVRSNINHHIRLDAGTGPGNDKVNRLSWFRLGANQLFLIASVAYAGLWTSLLIPFFYAVEDAPKVVIAYIMFMVIVFSIFPVIFYATRNYSSKEQIIKRELYYTSASFLSKIPLLVLFWTGVVMRSGTIQFEVAPALNTEGNGLSDGELLGIFGGVTATSILFGVTTFVYARHVSA